LISTLTGNLILRVGGISQSENIEIREYEGQMLSSINDFRENSIEGPQYINKDTYRLTISGLVDDVIEYSYDDVINNFNSYKKVSTLRCVEGWSVTLLWEGILVKDLIEDAGVNPNATVMIFHAYDNYTTSFPFHRVMGDNYLMAYKMNNISIPAERGFPFQLVAEGKLGYKWIKWITEIELSDDEEYLGYWESRGYPNEPIPEFSPLIILPIFLVGTIFLVIVRKKFQKK
jgi:DMSO/TMAO reductase YedYZ molybdopterin-dependent catalytic subunit